MKQIKGILFVFAGLAVMVTLISLLMPSRVMMVRTINIRQSQDSVYRMIADLAQWRVWHPVFQQEATTVHISQPSKGQSAKASWTSSGKLNELIIVKDSAFVLEASLLRVNENPVTYFIRVSPLNNPSEVEVEWKSVIPLKWYPWEKFSGMLIDKMTGPGYEQALNILKEKAEQ